MECPVDRSTERKGRGYATPLAGILYAAVVLGASMIVVGAEEPTATRQQEIAGEHEALFAEGRFPSATTCAPCHEDIYREWSVSAHAYAQMSPVFNAMHAKILKETNGTNGDFCIRCHTPVGMNLEEPEFMSNLDRHPTSREGITCIVCHRLDQPYGKISGRLPIVEGSLYEPIFGPSGNDELQRAIESGEFNLQTDPERAGRGVHSEALEFSQLPTPGLCGSCHDVNLVNGFRLEEAFSEYKHTPAAAAGVSCQDCHMGTEPGVPSGYAIGPAARVGNRETRPRKRTNHMFAGPDYSIVHPGIFPHNTEAQELATLREWLTFDHQAGWGTDEFEDTVPDDFQFPPRWVEPDDRYDAADIIRDNLELLDEIAEQRLKLLQAGYQLGEVVVDRADDGGISFRVEFSNGTDGHNVPTGFDAERVVWLHVTVTDATGRVVFESGDLDPNGDVRDSHSVYVHDGALPADEHLFSLQSRFLVRMVRGGEREQVLTIPYSPDPLPFLRPSTSSTILTGRPVGARKHRQTIPPLGSKWASYSVDREALAGTTGPYYANIQIKAGMVPVNLVHEIEDVGFDYGMTARDVADAVVEGHVVVRNRDVDLTGGGVETTAAPGPRRAETAPAGHDDGEHEDSRITDHYIPLQLEGFPRRPKPLLELGPPFLGTGRIGRGISIPGGAVWTPSFLLFGTLRSGFGTYDDGTTQHSQWANRLDLFGNLALTGTERVVIGLRPTHQGAQVDSGAFGALRFTGYSSPSSGSGGFSNQLNFDWNTLTHLFFEGDLGEMFPNLDVDDRRGLDLGLSIGRQPINFQEGLLVNDFIDAVGVTRNNLRPGGAVNLRFTGLYGWNEITRHSVIPDPDSMDPYVPHNSPDAGAHLFGGFTEIDWRSTTTAFDVMYVRGGALGTLLGAADGLYTGLSLVGRPGSGAFNTALRVVTSMPLGDGSSTPSPMDETTANLLGIANPVSRGTLVFSEVSWTPHHSNNFFYANGFFAHDTYRAAALDVLIPGPLARAGILFAGSGLGDVPGVGEGALMPTASNVTGGAFGHQMFFAGTRQQLLFEGAARYSTAECRNAFDSCEPHQFAGGVRYQAAVGRRGVLVLDAFVARDSLRDLSAIEDPGRDSRRRVGGRAEFVVKF